MAAAVYKTQLLELDQCGATSVISGNLKVKLMKFHCLQSAIKKHKTESMGPLVISNCEDKTNIDGDQIR